MNFKSADMRNGIVFSLLMVLSTATLGQSVDSTAGNVQRLTLDECLNIALENNLQLKRASNDLRVAKSNDFQALMNFLPSVNAAANYRFNAGTNFDANSGSFANSAFENSFPGVSANLTVFNGLSSYHNKRATAKALEASTNQIQSQRQDVQANVLGLYLAVVLDKENIKIGQKRIELLEAQLKRAESRHSVGVVNLEQVYNFRSQLANEKLTQVNLKNLLLSDQLTLIQVLQLETRGQYDVAPYDFGEDNELLTNERFDNVLNEVLTTAPSIKGAEARLESARYNQKSVLATGMPTLSVVGNYGTQYSSINDNGDFGIRDQYQNLTSRSLNVQLSIPIFNNGRTWNNYQIARINKENANLDLKQAELTMVNTVQQVYLDLVTAQETFKAAEENLNALNQSYEFVKTRYENGNTDFYTYLESLNNKNRAEVQLVNAKYSIIFRKKILDVYRGLL